ncbi:Exocyst subunit exo70 family protein G1 [Hibiscus syriacus]|uniref:Exocyst subunit exo70 family protein G1 n=1 Tax=Hibiscus syriacus TaxID=106335 RepID=A0A6A2WE02_HIBSY|nr:uncharacterized protein LOC120193849 [Hibiscus syriacus]KAE8656652.1 Exocyst subunit exo70 family protein G1 [Hibiscus syriacus]
MEVLVGLTFGMEAATSAAATATFVRERQPEEKNKGSSSCFFLKEDVDVSSESSPSIGSSGGSDDEEEDDVVSSMASGSLGSLGSLEDSLPIKRGLSNHYAGKSKSFANLLDVSTVKEVEKAENPFNKRRRILLANKRCRSRKTSFYSWQNPNSMPLLALNEDDEETPSTSSNDDNPATIKSESQQSELKVTHKSQSCFSLTDLQVQVEPQ